MCTHAHEHVVRTSFYQKQGSNVKRLAGESFSPLCVLTYGDVATVIFLAGELGSGRFQLRQPAGFSAAIRGQRCRLSRGFDARFRRLRVACAFTHRNPFRAEGDLGTQKRVSAWIQKDVGSSHVDRTSAKSLRRVDACLGLHAAARLPWLL